MDTMNSILQRYSCRNYTDRPVEGVQLQKLLQAADASPVACGRYEDSFLTVVRDPAFLRDWDASAAGGKQGHPLYAAGTVILISSRIAPDIPHANPYLNAGIIAENIVLEAEALGLGTVILAGPVRALLRDKPLLARLGLPAGLEPAVAVAVGYPAESKEGKAKKHHIPTNYLG